MQLRGFPKLVFAARTQKHMFFAIWPRTPTRTGETYVASVYKTRSLALFVPNRSVTHALPP